MLHSTIKEIPAIAAATLISVHGASGRMCRVVTALWGRYLPPVAIFAANGETFTELPNKELTTICKGNTVETNP
jgi:hypothetical protein